jgi:cell division protein FtsZ
VVAKANVAIRALGVDTDAASNRVTDTEDFDFLLVGGSRFSGHGTGGDAVNGRLAIQDDFKNLDPFLEDVRMVVLVTSLGAGTGGGASPEILKYCHERGITTLCFATLPFAFEGPSRTEEAQRVMSLLEDNADTLITVPQDDLYAQCGSDNLQTAKEIAVETLGEGIALMWRMLCMPGYIQLDVERLRSLVVSGKNARLGFALSTGATERVPQIVDQLKNFKLLRGAGRQIAAAEALLVGIIAGDDLLLSEVAALMTGIKALYPNISRVEMGTVQDALFHGRIEVVLLAFHHWTKPVAVGFAPGSVALDQPPVVDVLPISPSVRKGKGKMKAKGSKLSFGPTGRGKFQNSEPSIYEGVDLDVPAYIRYGINIEK